MFISLSGGLYMNLTQIAYFKIIENEDTARIEITTAQGHNSKIEYGGGNSRNLVDFMNDKETITKNVEVSW